MAKSNYFNQRNIKTIKMIRQRLAYLPYFVHEFFVGIEMQTSPLTRLNYATDLRIFFDYLVNSVPYFINKEIKELVLADLEEISTTDIEMFMSYLSYYEIDGKAYTNSQHGKARKLSTIRTMFKYFYNKDKLSKNVASKITMPKLHQKEIVRLDDDEVKQLLDILEAFNLNSQRQNVYNKNNVKSRDLAIISLLLGTGIRVSECVGLNIEDIDFKNNAFIVTRKGGNRTTLYFSNEIKEILQRYLAERKELGTVDNPALFLSLQNNRLTVRAVQYIVRKYTKLISPLKKITPHKLRSTYGTNLYKATKDIYVVAEVLGHQDVNTTKKHYAAISEDIKKQASTKVTLR